MPTDEKGHPTAKGQVVFQRINHLAQQVGEHLVALFQEPDRQRLRDLINTGRGGPAPVLVLRVRETGPEHLHRADRLLALPWELIYLDGCFPVREGLLDLMRETVTGQAEPSPPKEPLTLLAAIAAPVDQRPLSHEEESCPLHFPVRHSCVGMWAWVKPREASWRP